MKQEVLSRFSYTWLPITALILFLVCFFLYVYWTYRKENKKQYEEASLIPLQDLQPTFRGEV